MLRFDIFFPYLNNYVLTRIKNTLHNGRNIDKDQKVSMKAVLRRVTPSSIIFRYLNSENKSFLMSVDRTYLKRSSNSKIVQFVVSLQSFRKSQII